MFNDRIFWIVQSFLKYLPFNTTRSFRGWVYRPFFRHFGARVRIEDGVTIKYPSQIEIGNDSVINQNCFLVGLGGLSIGHDVMIGNNSVVISTSHVTTDPSIPMRLQGIRAEKTIIGDDVWVGSGATILGGASIGSHSIVAAGAVVRANAYPDYVVLGGVPAEIIKMRNAGRESAD